MKPSDETYLKKFQNRDLDPESFDHRGHLYMAWLHLNHYELEVANNLVCNGIRELAGKFGVPEKYNRTITEALMRIMSNRLKDCPNCSFDEYLNQNPDLLNNAKGLLLYHYTEQRLESAEAKKTWLQPDLNPIE